MKCGSYVLYVEARKKGSGEPYQRVKETVSWWGTSDMGIRNDAKAPSSLDLLQRGYNACHGTVQATVSAVDDPYWGGTSAQLEIDYKCDTCGQTFFPELPATAEDLSKFVTDMVARLGSDDVAAMRSDFRERHLKQYGVISVT